MSQTVADARPRTRQPVPFPPLVDLVVAKPTSGDAGFDRCEPRGPRIVGVCDHITAGEMSIEGYAAFFGIDGERGRDALVDTVIGRDGRIGLLNDWRDPKRGGTRAGWANGGSNGLEGPGVEFVARLGATAINQRLVSKEHVARSGQRLTDAQIAASIALDTAVLDAAGVRWHEYPRRNDLGIAVRYGHKHFATKGCPEDVFMGIVPVLDREVLAILTRYQTGSTNPDRPAPAPVPVPPKSPGWPERLFGALMRTMPDGTRRMYPYDPKGPISVAWLARCRKEGLWPTAGEWYTVGTKHFISFSNGWVLYSPRIDDYVNWRWVDRVDLVAEGLVAA